MVNLVTKSEYSTRVVKIIENPEEKDKKKRRIVNEILTPEGKEAEKKYLHFLSSKQTQKGQQYYIGKCRNM